MNLVEKVKQVVTPANLISISRPLIAWYGISHFSDKPVYLSLTLAAAFATDALDGVLARYFKQDKGIGTYVDIAADRSLELLTLWHFALVGEISYAFPIIFSVKGAVTDYLRISRDLKRKDFSKPLKYGGNDKRSQRFLYALSKAVFICGIPVFNSLANNVFGIIAVAYGIYRSGWVFLDRQD